MRKRDRWDSGWTYLQNAALLLACTLVVCRMVGGCWLWQGQFREHGGEEVWMLDALWEQAQQPTQW